MHRRITATATAVVAAASLALVGAPTPELAPLAIHSTTEATPYQAYKGAGYVCSALDMASPERAALWLHQHRGYSASDATTLVELAQAHGCQA